LELIERKCQYSWPVCAGAVPAVAALGQFSGGSFMQWQTPKLVEIACGCEINAYFPADL
jgi:coenzyme PQQ precursor peptide PqqA